MKLISLQRTASPGEAAQALECLILDGKSEADRDWVKTQSGLEEAVREAVCTLPPRTGHNQAGQPGPLSLVWTEEGTEIGRAHV